MSLHWSWDDLRILGDIVVGSLLASAVRLIAAKAFLEPLAVWAGRSLYRRADALVGDALPDWWPIEQRPDR